MFKKIAIANRGEVAVRIIRACQELGIETILLHSEVDVNSRAYRMCDIPVCIGPAAVGESYLNIDANINGAKSYGADAIHPGFGFLSENSDFAKRCIEEGMIFIGPTPESIRLFGDKISAKKLVDQIGVPTIPGYQGEDQSLEKLIVESHKIGFPIIVKAAAGGGGRGLKIAVSSNDLQSAIESAQREGLSAFGSSEVFLERYLGQAKHIEVQVFGDAKGEVFVLGERECSVQRRHQKIVEEAPSAKLSLDLKEKIFAAAVSIAEAAKYKGAGTVEFLVENDEYFFLEMNTRLQVEHPVTELVYSVDLVKAQIFTGQEMGLQWFKSELIPRGHSIECRIYAEDAYANGIPSTGELGACEFPQGPGRRFEFGFEEKDSITANYDSMIAKVIVWDETRMRAIQKMQKTLEETLIFGVKTNIPYLQKILSHPEFVDGTMTTQFITKNFPTGLSKEEDYLEAEIVSYLRKQFSGKVEPSDQQSEFKNPWERGLW